MASPLFVNEKHLQYFHLRIIATGTYVHRLILTWRLCLIKRNLTLFSSPSAFFFFFFKHPPQTHSAYPIYRSMIIHMAMRLDRAGSGAMGVFLDDDLGVLQLLCQEQGIETYPGRGPLPPPVSQSAARVEARTGREWERQKSKSRQHPARSVFLSGSRRSPPMIDGFIIGLFEKRFSFTLKGDISEISFVLVYQFHLQSYHTHTHTLPNFQGCYPSINTKAGPGCAPEAQTVISGAPQRRTVHRTWSHHEEEARSALINNTATAFTRMNKSWAEITQTYTHTHTEQSDLLLRPEEMNRQKKRTKQLVGNLSASHWHCVSCLELHSGPPTISLSFSLSPLSLPLPVFLRVEYKSDCIHVSEGLARTVLNIQLVEALLCDINMCVIIIFTKSRASLFRLEMKCPDANNSGNVLP